MVVERGRAGRLVVSLIVGATITWAIGWLLGALDLRLGIRAEFFSHYIVLSGNHAQVLVTECRSWGACRRSCSVQRAAYKREGSRASIWRLESAGPRRGIPEPQSFGWGTLAHANPELHADPTIIEDARGWPFLSQWCEFVIDDQQAHRMYSGEQTTPFVTRGGFLLGGMRSFDWDLSDARVLPCRAIWPGFLANSALYACAWMLIFGGRRSIRAHLRRHRGLCPRCAYDLRATSAHCPECAWQPR